MNLLSGVQKTLLEFYWTVTRAIGLKSIHGHEKEVFINLLFYPFYPIFFVVAQVMRPTSCRFVEAPLNGRKAIGHLALDYDCFFKELILENRSFKIILVGDVGPVANEAMFAYWSPRMTVVTSKPIRVLAERLLIWFPSLKLPIAHYCHFVRGATMSHLVQRKWGDRPPLVKLSDADLAQGEAQLREMGVPQGAWFVCIHNREPGYAPENEWASSHRNSDISSYMKAMKLIIASGGWCIRMGDSTMQTLAPMANVVDYAHSKFKSDWMDIFLCARCRFFLGNSSGLFVVSGIFGRPTALTNHSPISSIFTQFPRDLSICKLYSDENGKLIPFDVLFGTELSEYRYTYEFENRKVMWINNSEDEIADLALEMMGRMASGEYALQPDDEYQAELRSLMRPHHFGWYSIAQPSSSFLRRHRDLLPSSHTLVDFDTLKTGS